VVGQIKSGFVRGTQGKLRRRAAWPRHDAGGVRPAAAGRPAQQASQRQRRERAAADVAVANEGDRATGHASCGAQPQPGGDMGAKPPSRHARQQPPPQVAHEPRQFQQPRPRVVPHQRILTLAPGQELPAFTDARRQEARNSRRFGNHPRHVRQRVVHVGQQVAAVDARLVGNRGFLDAAGQQADPGTREIDAASHRQRQRSPGARIHLQQNPALTVVAHPELEHRQPGIVQPVDHGGDGSQLLRAQFRADPVVAARRGFPHATVLEALQHAPAVCQHRHPDTVARHEPLEQMIVGIERFQQQRQLGGLVDKADLSAPEHPLQAV